MAHGSVESYNIGILLRISTLDISDPDAALVGPALQCCTDTLRLVVTPNHARTSTPENEADQPVRNLFVVNPSL